MDEKKYWVDILAFWFAYLDESKEQNSFFVYSTLIVRGDRWSDAFSHVREFRRGLKSKYGIYMTEELHAWKFAAGKGRISEKAIFKKQRAEIYREVLEFIATCGFFRLMSSVNTNEKYAFERLMNRINRTAVAKNNAHVLLFSDEGQEAIFTKRIRKMRVYNPIPSSQGTWAETGNFTQNIPLSQFVEDPIFKDSKNSYFIQLVDFAAYALLRSERPIPSRSVLGYDKLYDILRPVTVSENNPRDPRGLGIIR